MGIDAVHLTGLDQRGDDGPVFSSGVVSCEQGVLAVQGDGADGAFDGVVVDLDAAIGEEAAKAVAVFCDVGKGLAQGRLCRGAAALQRRRRPLSVMISISDISTCSGIYLSLHG